MSGKIRGLTLLITIPHAEAKGARREVILNRIEVAGNYRIVSIEDCVCVRYIKQTATKVTQNK